MVEQSTTLAIESTSEESAVSRSHPKPPALSERTETVYGTENAIALEVQVAKNAKARLDSCLDRTGPSVTLGIEAMRESLIEMAKRGVKVRLLTEITKENIDKCKRLAGFAEIRHLTGVKGNFALSESEYIATSSTLKDKGKKTMQLLYSSVQSIIEQQQYLFDVLWSNATPSAQRFAELESAVGIQPETKIVRGGEQIRELTLGFVQRSTQSYLRVATDKRTPRDPRVSLALNSLTKHAPNFRLQIITDIQPENLEYNKKLIQEGAIIRHFDRNRIAFAVSKDEYLAAELSAVEEQIETGAEFPSEVIWSNRADVVSQANQIFEMLWDTAITAEARMKQLELGVDPVETRILDNLDDVYKMGARIVEECKSEVFIILASDKTILRNASQFSRLDQRRRSAGVRIKILSPTMNPEAREVIPGADWRKMEEPMKVSILIYDREKMFITQYLDSNAKTTERAVYSNIYTTNRHTISGMVSVFEALWRESEMRDEEAQIRRELTHALAKEERSRRQAQLLQDILTHDIRNYNQISMLSAELLKERLESTGDREGMDLADSLLASVDGATSLVERGKKLGRILAEENPRLYPVNLAESLQASLALVRQANPHKTLREQMEVPGLDDAHTAGPLVLADDLLDEVFTNVFANAAKYTEGSIVPLKIKLRSEDGYWKVSITDEGVGIPETMREKIFERYVAGARGSGLGMSIIHALVVNRYGGRAFVASESSKESKERKKKGTTIEVWLRSVPS